MNKNKIKKVLLVLLLLCLTVLVGCTKGKQTSIFSRPTVQKVEGQRKDWLDVSSFICYYGDFDVEIQSQFDVVIMHSNTLFSNPNAKALVKELQDKGSYVIAYITIGEDDTLNQADGMGEGGYASYYVYENGAPKQNVNWGSYFVDAGNPVWQQKIINKSAEIISYGVDGLFMDTLDTVDLAYDTLPGMVSLVKKLKETYPETKLVANRGFTCLPYISSYIDGMMFESFNTTYDFVSNKVADLDEAANAYNETVACSTINAIRRYDYFPVFALDYVNKNEIEYMTQSYYNRSWQYDFIPYCTYDISLATAVLPKDVSGSIVVPTSRRGELALSKIDSNGLDGYNADITENNLAYKENGAIVTVSSTYTGYNTAPLNDGWYVTNDNHIQELWAKEAWASTDNKNADHYIQFEFSEEKEVTKVVVHWANDNGTFYSPQECLIQALVDNEWVEVSKLNNLPEEGSEEYKAFEESWTFIFDKVNTTKIRIVQPKSKGCADKFGDAVREGIMWVSEIEIFS